MNKVNLEKIGIVIVMLVAASLVGLMIYQIVTDCYDVFIKK